MVLCHQGIAINLVNKRRAFLDTWLVVRVEERKTEELIFFGS